MDAYIFNSETKEQYNFQYFEPQISLGGLQAVYQSVDSPGSVIPKRHWIRTEALQSQINLITDGRFVDDGINRLKKLIMVQLDKKSIPKAILKLGDLPVMPIHIISVIPRYDYSFTNKLPFPDLTIDYLDGAFVARRKSIGSTSRIFIQVTFIEAFTERDEFSKMIERTFRVN